MKNFSCVEVCLVNSYLFIAPAHKSAERGLLVIKTQDSRSISYDCDSAEKGMLLRQVLEVSGGTVSEANFNEQEYLNSLKPVLMLAGVKTIGAFYGKALSFSVYLKNSLEFTPHEYHRGGFSGRGKDTHIVLPSDASPEDISKAIDDTLELCIAKGGKRLADFQKAPRLPQNDLEASTQKVVAGKIQ